MGRSRPVQELFGPCTPEALAALGPLLCLYRAVEPNALSGWTWAESVRALVSVESGGPREALAFFDADQRTCWQLHRLPDSDYLAWEQVVQCLDRQTSVAPPRLSWRMPVLSPIQRAIGSPLWRACALRLHAVPGLRSRFRLAAGDVALSDAGQRAAVAIAKAEGASAEPYRPHAVSPIHSGAPS